MLQTTNYNLYHFYESYIGKSFKKKTTTLFPTKLCPIEPKVWIDRSLCILSNKWFNSHRQTSVCLLYSLCLQYGVKTSLTIFFINPYSSYSKVRKPPFNNTRLWNDHKGRKLHAYKLESKLCTWLSPFNNAMIWNDHKGRKLHSNKLESKISTLFIKLNLSQCCNAVQCHA